MENLLSENLELLGLRESVKSRFYLSVETIFKMVKELESKNYQWYILEMPLEINSPMEDAIRYKYIVLIELFKRFARAISYTYFRYERNTSSEEKYYKMNLYILKDKDVVENIGEILDDRNNLAHIFIDGILDFTDNNFLERVKKTVILYEVLEIYIEFVNKNDPSNNIIRKIYLK